MKQKYVVIVFFSNLTDISSPFPRFTGGRRFGHYTQLVWANTTLLGCGYLEREVPDGLSVSDLSCEIFFGGNPFGGLAFRIPVPPYRDGGRWVIVSG